MSSRNAGVVPSKVSVTDLGTLGGTESSAWGINGLGQVTGWSYTADNGPPRAFLWTPTTPNGASGTMIDAVGRAAIDAYLDSVEQALFAVHAPRGDRVQVLQDLESQIADML